MFYNPMKLIRKFHKAFRVQSPDFRPEALALRKKLILEEAQEVAEALDELAEAFNYDSKTIIEAHTHLAKELADLLVVTYGTADTTGIPVEDAFKLVMDSNMSKLGSDGKPIYREDGKVLKGPNYYEPNLGRLFRWRRA